MSASTDDLVRESFRKAISRFRDGLPDRKLYNEINTETTAEDVYDLLKKIQEDAASRGDMRYMAKMRPFIERLKEYGPTLDTFCSAKPEVMALIWGPIRFIIQWANQFYKILDSIADATVKIATALPHFASVVQIFPKSDTIKLALVLFYENILDFYAAILQYHKKRGWQRAIEAAWPRVAGKIEVITKNIVENTQRMTTEVTFLDIEEAHKARIQALEHFEATHTFQETQKFLGLKTRLGPVLYDERLDSLRHMPHLEKAEWLTRDRAFLDWLDVSKRDRAWLWMEGKPGAGKTFIAAAAIDYAKQIHPTLFIFANQMNEEKLTALSSIQSLIFQAAIDDKGLQAALVESNERDLRSDTSQTSQLLKSLIKSAGPTYIVIDGLNEIAENERRVLMEKLDDIVKDCKELKILICSQSHHDISTALANKAERISVHQKNFGTIERYVRKRSREWIDNSLFDDTFKSTMRCLLMPLAARAEGMFLYARIVLDNLGHLHGVDEIQRELEALPSNIDEAYGRIYSRINNLSPRLRDKCRRVLIWIGYAPVPLTELELQQAVLLEESHTPVQSVAGTFNFVRACEPIIEVINDRPRFVHFTAKEYVFDDRIQGSISSFQAKLEMALATLTYLGSQILETNISNSNLDTNLLGGRYRLLEYFACHWLKIVLPIAKRTSNIPPSFSEHLTWAAKRGRSELFQRGMLETSDTLFQNAILERKSPDGYEMLCSALDFHRNENTLDWSFKKGSEKWIRNDPLTVSCILRRVRGRFENMVCERERHDLKCGHTCLKLQQHYTTHLYKCAFPFCESSRLGFQSKSERDNHIRHHGKPWQCLVTSCPWPFGFTTKVARDKHWLMLHWTPGISQTDRFDGLDEDEVQPLLFRYIVESNVDGVRDILGSAGGASLERETLAAARNMAVKKGSFLMAQLLSLGDEKYFPASLVVTAVKSEDVDIVQWALRKSDPRELSTLTKAMLKTDSDSIYRLWEEHLVRISQSKASRQISKSPLKVLFRVPIFRQVGDNEAREKRLKHTWDVLIKRGGNLGNDTLSAALVALASSTCSRPLAEFLIDHGADMDYPKNPFTLTRSSGKTALRQAAESNSAEAARFMEYLLDRGAHPFQSKTGRYTLGSEEKIGELPGPKQIFSSVGSTWKQIVDRNAEKRKYKNYSAMVAVANKAHAEEKRRKRDKKRRVQLPLRHTKSNLKEAKSLKRRGRGVDKSASKTTHAHNNRQ